MTLLICCLQSNGFYVDYVKNFLKTTKGRAVSIICGECLSGKLESDLSEDIKIFKLKSLDYMVKNADPRVYEKFLEILGKDDYNTGLILRLDYPEFLENELKVSGLYAKKNIFFTAFGYELLQNSIARAKCVERLIESEAIAGVFFHGIDLNPIAPEWCNDKTLKSCKVTYVSEPNYENSCSSITKREYWKSQFGLNDNVFVVLYTGAFFYGKGADILINAAEHVESNVRIIMAGDMSTANFDFDFEKEISKLNNIQIVNRWLDTEDLNSLYELSDCVVLPYRKTYEYGTSGVFHKSLIMKKPVIAPNIEPFTNTYKTYPYGMIFTAEDALDLASVINTMKSSNQNFEDTFQKYNFHHVGLGAIISKLES